MGATEILNPQGFAEIVYGAAKRRSRQERASALRPARLGVTALLTAALKKLGKSAGEDLLKRAKAYLFEPLFEAIVGSATLGERRQAAEKVAALYARVFKLLDADEETSKDVVEDVTSQSDQVEKSLRLCPEKEGSAVERSRPVAMTVVKPGDPSTPETVTLSPDFARFLREQHGQEVKGNAPPGMPTDIAVASGDLPAKLLLVQLLTKKSFEEWLQEDAGQRWLEQNCLALPRSSEQGAEKYAELYRIALHKAFQLYEQGAYQKEYCVPQRTPMPGIQYGHRLLRLPVVVEEADFSSNGIYCGPEANLQIPDVDFEELVRRYVSAMRLSAITIYSLDDISEDYVRRFLADQTLIIDPKRIAIFATGVMQAISSRPLLEFIRNARDQGRDLTPEQVADWLKSENGSALKDSILSSWAGALPDILPATSAEAFQAIASKLDFQRLFVGLCAPELNGSVGPQNAGAAYDSRHPTAWTIDGASGITYTEKATKGSFATAVLSRIDRLVGVYERVWRTARSILGQADLPRPTDPLFESYYSGYEFKSYACWLTVSALSKLSSLDFAYNQPATGLREQTARGAAEDLKGTLTDWNLLAPAEGDVVAELGTTPQFYSGVGFSSGFQGRLDKIVASYGACLDLILDRAPSASIGTGSQSASTGEDADKLFNQWTEVFADLLRAFSAKRGVAKDNQMFLRLAPRPGRYGEVLKPEAVGGSGLSILKAQGTGPRMLTNQKIMPSHPRVQTEQYVLEPIPKRFACEPVPTLYLREDLSLWVRHRGFGIGANLYSMSLLPEEEQVITVKSFKDTKTKTTESSAENLFEEQTDESSQDFGSEMTNESERETSSQSEFSISGKASASWGWGSASIESGYSTQSSSRSLAKNAANVTNRLASKLSAKRTVAVETKRTKEVETAEHQEVATERKVRNPNKGHTLTFHWFQMTRKLATELRLDDIKFVYTSGKHVRQVVFGNGRRPSDVLDKDFKFLPDDIGRKLPPDSVIVVCTPPYTESVSMASANAFLARVFGYPKAAEINAMVWRIIGAGRNLAPDGYGVAAFCEPSMELAGDSCKWFPVTDWEAVLGEDYDLETKTPTKVPSDEIHRGQGRATLYLANLDLRYKREDGLAPPPYSADEFDAYSLPRTLLRQEQVINTNGVYCDAMVGQCSALEDYLQRHRDLDLLEKELEVGHKELDFRWALAKDGMATLGTDAGGAIVGLVNEATHGSGFQDRLAVERARLAEEKKIREKELDMQRKEQEVKILEAQAAEIERRIATLGTPVVHVIQVPSGSELKVDAHIGSGAEGPHTSLKVTSDGT